MRLRAAWRDVDEAAPNLAPMVDVIMVLLIFFMLGASISFTREGVLRTELDPRSGPGAGLAIEVIPSVRIAMEDVDEGQACRMYVMGEPLPESTPEALHSLLQERVKAGVDPRNPVVIAAQPAVRWRFVVAAMDAAVDAGFTDVQFAVALGETGS